MCSNETSANVIIVITDVYTDILRLQLHPAAILRTITTSSLQSEPHGLQPQSLKS